MLACASVASAQEAPPQRFGAARLSRESLFPPDSEPASRAAPPAAASRACEGCPERRVGHALLAATYVNVIYGSANLIRGQVTARITPKTWWANMQQGWVWDLDDFIVNQFGHPYQGNNYFTAGRANGLSYWESAGIAAFGSGTWEYFGETNHASMNDLLNTTLGGMALGEMFYRTAWLVRDPNATGSGRFMKELLATAIDPVTGLTRFATGESSRVSAKPADLVPSSLGGNVSAGALWRGNEASAFQAEGQPFLELDLLYGDPRRGRSHTPYDAFGVLMRLGGGKAVSEVKVRGRLLGQPFRQERLQVNVQQAYDFNQNSAYQFGAQSFNVAATFTTRLSSRSSLWMSGWGGLTALGAIDSIPLTGKVDEPTDGDAGQGVSEGPRYYDYGPGGNVGGWANITRDGRPIVAFVYEAHHIYSLDGVRANHFLQQLRLDLTAPLRGPIGIGVSGEYFDRRTYYKEAANETRKFHFPQIRAFLTWRMQ